jgi:8-oxo-dGTP pyrophosphatase MutT (NUDIX family)
MTISRCEAEDRVIRIVAAVVAGADGQTLLVRKRGTAAFMQPGGKLAPGETPISALEREIGEELGCALDRISCRSLGTVDAPAANEPGFTVNAQLFAATLMGEVRAKGEIEEIAWVDPDMEPLLHLAPLTRDHALPFARDWKSRLRSPAQ